MDAIKSVNLEHLTSIVVLNYNAGNLLLDCIESIYKTRTYKFEVIVVDNVSTDNSHIKCKERFPQIRLIELENDAEDIEEISSKADSTGTYSLEYLNPVVKAVGSDGC